MNADFDIGRDLYDLTAQVFPLHRSITGSGTRATLDLVSSILALDVVEVPSGTSVFDWTVPREWSVREAWLADPTGRRIVDIADNPLHLLGYSTPVTARLSLDQLRPHLFSLPDRPTSIPFRTSYYNDNWGFCLTDELAKSLTPGEYQVRIDTSLSEGSLTYGELVLPGVTDTEILVTTHICHPAMANDNATGIAVASKLAAHLQRSDHHHTFRFLFIPGTIGSITWLAQNQAMLPKIHAGLVLTGLGDTAPLTWKRSRRGNSLVDEAAQLALVESGLPHRIRDFSPYGYDERQFCSPGINLPVGRFGRGQHGEYPEYHTSADDLAFVSADRLGESYKVLLRLLEILDSDRVYVSTNPMCEPQLGRRGLYRTVGEGLNHAAVEMALLWVMNLADGEHGLLDMARRADLPFDTIRAAADALRIADLLVESAAPPA